MLIIDVPASVRGFISAAGEFGHAKSGMKGPLGNDRSKPAPPGSISDGIYVAVEGTAELIRDKAAFQQHSTSDLDNWFENGVSTPGIVLIKVKASHATYWKGREEGEVEL
jgi:hypothetical protein